MSFFTRKRKYNDRKFFFTEELIKNLKVEESKGTATILSDENASLKEKIKELQAGNELLVKEIQSLKDKNDILQNEIESLRDSNTRLGSRLQTIRKLACYDEADVEIDD